ncbi:MAG: 5-dehydro-4-deoxy-D-glucuronate isomerase [Sphaerochaetaceae bacterium]|nr:5-dehydro-4-deoxy-D-glucuronate isomerase [Sphaerochaetaceae bacterium]
MDVREYVNSEYSKHLDTEGLRKNYLIETIFADDQVTMTYSHVDRMIAGGIKPVKKTLDIKVDKEIGTEYFLERRELGLINIGEAGVVTVDGKEYEVNHADALYIGKGSRDLKFASKDASKPAKFYYNSCPAHMAYPTKLVPLKDAVHVEMGSLEESNKRVINKYFEASILDTCALSMGMTHLEEGSCWNTMPVHTHERRMEVYFYFDLPDDRVVFHLMGKPDEIRTIVVRNEQAVISPAWSIHAGAGVGNYTFIWGMTGENKTYSDQDWIAMKDLR